MLLRNFLKTCFFSVAQLVHHVLFAQHVRYLGTKLPLFWAQSMPISLHGACRGSSGRFVVLLSVAETTGRQICRDLQAAIPFTHVHPVKLDIFRQHGGGRIYCREFHRIVFIVDKGL